MPSTVSRALVPIALALFVLAAAAPQSDAAFGPKAKKCAKLKKSAKKKCQKQNKTAKTVFDAVKDGRYVGDRRAGGAPVDITLCANGKWSIIVTAGGEANAFSGARWTLMSTDSRSGRIWALVDAPSKNVFTDEFFLVRRGSSQWGWTRGNPTLDNLAPLVRTDARAACASM